MSPTQVNLPLPSGFRLERYRVERQIAFGGFSMVYLAYDEAETPFAIKEFMPQALALRTGDASEPQVGEANRTAFNQGLKCFFEEGRTLSRLQHRNVARVTDFFRANGTAYMVMEYERGRTLREHVKRHSGPLTEKFIREVFVQLLDGLQEVHGNGLLHLDIKPANIYLRSDNSPVLLDFGATRHIVGGDQPELKSVQTPGYAAPEQSGPLAGCGAWTDIYGIGASMYFSLAAASPLASEKRAEKDELPPAQKRWQGRYSQHLLQLIDRCLLLAPAERPQSARELQHELTQAPPGTTRATRILATLRGKLLGK